ncbi:hypothetical protein TcCL_NonESM10114 [Trypanosoma cruzi]|nr:hypothetical protein TcCL_NonESM10114 [Trypanosoma cruzi]
MAAGCNAATWSVPALVCLSRHQDCSVVEAFGCKSGANGHFTFCRDPATLYGCCLRLRGRVEGDGVTGVIVSVLFCVGVCALVGTVCDRMSLCVTVFICCCSASFFSSDRAVKCNLASPARLSFQGVRD